MCPPFFHCPRKVFLSSLDWPRREYNWTLLKRKLSDFFENWSRNRMMNSFIIVNITPTCKRWFRGEAYVVYSFLSYVRKKIET